MKLRAALFLALFLIPHVSYAKQGLGTVFGMILGKTAGEATEKAATDTPTIEHALSEMTERINKNLPVMIDSSTRAENITSGPGRRFTSNFTTINVSSAEIDKAIFAKKDERNIEEQGLRK